MARLVVALAGLVLGLAGLALGLSTAPLSAQDPGLTFVAGLAYEDGGPGPALVTGLREIEMDGTRPGSCHVTVCIEPAEHPFYFDEGLNLVVLAGFRYRFRAPISVDLLFSNGQRGHAEGYNSETFDHVVIRYGTYMITSTVGAHAGPIRMAAGPVLKTTGWSSTLNATRDSSDRTSTLGGTVNASATVRFKDVFVALTGGVRWFPPADVPNPVGPIEADYSSAFIGITFSPASI